MIAIKEQLQKEKYNKITYNLGFSKDKDLSNILKIIPKAEYYYSTRSQNERSLDPKEISKKILGKVKYIMIIWMR